MPCMVANGSWGSTDVSSGSLRLRQNHQANFEFVFFGKLIVALIVRRDAHDRAGAVVHQNIVRNPDRNFLAVVGIDRIAAGVNAVLFDFADVAHFPGLALLRDQLIDLKRATDRCSWSSRATSGCCGASCNEVAP